jgi:DNA-directed RNA polymerase subunit E'/Rpb7
MPVQSPFQSVAVVTKVAIEPSKLGFALGAVKEKLNTTLFKYNEDVAGIPIAYEDVSFLPGLNSAKIFGESPWLHIEAQVKMTVFRPVLGERIYGRVNKVRTDRRYHCHISIIDRHTI